jgi:hypothetical protein
VLDLEPTAVPSADDEQIELRPREEAPELRLVRLATKTPNDLTDRETPERRPDLGVPEQVPLVDDAEQRVEKARVAQVHRGRFDRALAEVLLPRREAPHHVRGDEHVEVVSNGLSVTPKARESSLPFHVWPW